MRQLHVFVFSIFLIGFVSVESAVAATYEPGHGALQLWNETAMNAAPEWLKNLVVCFWLVVFALGLFFCLASCCSQVAGWRLYFDGADCIIPYPCHGNHSFCGTDSSVAYHLLVARFFDFAQRAPFS